MSLSKKYVYVHNCSLAANTPDNFRKVLGRAWVPSSNSGLQYGYDVKPPVMKMKFGPYIEWAHDYFYATEMPATTQIVSIKPNPHYFPAVEGSPTVDMGDLGETSASTIEDPCCGWYAYLGAFFANHFSDGNPLQILRNVLSQRKATTLIDTGRGGDHHMDHLHFPNDSCGRTINTTVSAPDLPDAPAGDYTVNLPPDDTGAPLEPVPELLGQQNNMKTRLFKDLWFQVMTPFSEGEDIFAEGKEKALASDLRFNYNFYLDAYEKQLRGDTLSEIQIPNLYLTVGLDGTIPYVLYLQNNVRCRFKDFEKLVLQEGYREYLIPAKQQPWLQDKNVYSSSFPMDATISFGTDRSTFVADALEDSKLDCSMLRRASEGSVLLDPSTTPISAYTHSTIKDYTPPEETPMDFTYAKRYYDTTSTGANSFGPQRRQLKTQDFYKWLLTLPDLPSSAVPLPSDHVFLGNQNDATDMALKTGLYQHDLSYLANYFILSGKINEIANIHLRTYQQMMRGDNPHSETILYRISKYSTDALPLVSRPTPVYEQIEKDFDRIHNAGIEPIQSIWIPNSNSIDVAEYVDTQIKYNKGYTYTVTAYELSVGTEYFYSQYYGKDAPNPQPEPEVCQEGGVIAFAGPYTLGTSKDEYSQRGDEATDTIVSAVIGPIMENTSLTDGEKYEQVNTLLTENSQWVKDPAASTDTSQATGMVFIVQADEVESKYNLVILSYCFDYVYDSEAFTEIANILNTNTSTSATQTESTSDSPACTIFAQLEGTLKVQGGIGIDADRNDLINRLEQLGITSPPSAEYSFEKQSRFKRRSCPDDWTEGVRQTLIDGTVGETVPLGSSGLEAVFLGEVKLEAVCECPPPEPCQESFLVTTFPSLKIHEVPYMLWSGQAIDSYPVGPDIEINPYRANNSEMLFQIGAGLGDYYEHPVAIYPREQARFEDLIKAQKSKDGRIQFRSDDPVQQFEMFMLTEKPTKYTHFSKGVHTKLSVNLEGKPGQTADAVSTIQKLEPNRKYYYIFRSVDIHGHISNPTPIYEVELVDTDGVVYPLINIYEPEVELPVDLSKKAQRLLQVRPEYLQSKLDDVGTGLTAATSAGTPGGLAIGDIKLGTREEKLWDKKFKLRLTSCETRRMLDINLTFNTEHQTAVICDLAEPQDKDTSNQGLELPDDMPLPGTEVSGTASADTSTTSTSSSTSTSSTSTSTSTSASTSVSTSTSVGTGGGVGGY